MRKPNWFVALLAAVALMLMGAAGERWPNDVSGSASSIPGLSRGVGNEQTLNTFLNLTEFAWTGDDSYTTYYVSAAAGGDYGVGDDENDGLTTSTAWRSICRADYAIETERFIRVVFDQGDTWSVLADHIDCDATIVGSNPIWEGATWDGSLGQPPHDCGSIERPCAFILSSDPATGKPTLDLQNQDEDGAMEDCLPNLSTPLDCRADNDTVLAGFATVTADGTDLGQSLDGGWLAVSNIIVEHSPPVPRRTTWNSNAKDMGGGNLVALNVEFPSVLPGNQLNFTSNHGGAVDIWINPVWNKRPHSDFTSTCSGGSSEFGCAGNASEEWAQLAGSGADCTGTDTCCTGNSVPWQHCNASSIYVGATDPFLVTAAGATILISNKEYTYDNDTDSNQTRYGTLFKNNASDLYVLGPMHLENGAFSAEPNLSALKLEHSSTAATTSRDIPHFVAAFTIIGGTTQATWGSTTWAPIQVTDNNKAAANWVGGEVQLHGVQVLDSALGLVQVDEVQDGVDVTNYGQLTIDLNCSDVGANWTDDLIRFDALASTDTDPVALRIRNTYIDEQTATEGVLDIAGTESATASAARTAINASTPLSCIGGTCTASNFDVEGSAYAWSNTITQAAPRLTYCPDKTEVRFRDSTIAGVPIRIPAYVTGATVVGFDFGGN